MEVKMKIEDIFKVAEKTIFVGDLITSEKAVTNVTCFIKSGEKILDEIKIEGEVLNGVGRRDLWTSSLITLDSSILQEQEVWLIAK